jgi:NADPH-dependent 7-cyano-7-deazaguanine reductase QueF
MWQFVTPLFTGQPDGMPNFETVNVKQVSESFEPESLSRIFTAF